MLGWSAVAGVVDWSIVTPMYFGGIAWGIMYDLIYAHQVSSLVPSESPIEICSYSSILSSSIRLLVKIHD